MDHNRTNTKHSSSNPSWKTKKLMCAGIIGMTAAVASSALLFLSVMDFSKHAQTEESFLLNDRGDKDSTCVVASGPWPKGSVSKGDDDDNGGPAGPFASCFYKEVAGNGPYDYCWSRSHIDSDGHLHPCTPTGFGDLWSLYSPGINGDPSQGDDDDHLAPVESCGTGCTEFSKFTW